MAERLNFQGEYITRGGLTATIEEWDGEAWSGAVSGWRHPESPGVIEAPAKWDAQGNAIDGDQSLDLVQRVKTPDAYCLL